VVKQRIAETSEGIQGKITVAVYDRFSRNMRDKGWNNLDGIINSGIKQGDVLEIGPGPGYLGLEWLRQSPGSTLTGCKISRDMISMATKNAKEYGLEKSVNYVECNSMQMPFRNNFFDAVFSNGSLHEWEEPAKVFNEINRVLKPGGIFYIADLRRDVNPLLKWLIYYSTNPKAIRPGFITSINAPYTVEELKSILNRSSLTNYTVQKEFFGLSISGKKHQ